MSRPGHRATDAARTGRWRSSAISRSALCAAAAALLSGCARPQAEPEPGPVVVAEAPRPDAGTFVYRCADGVRFSGRFRGDSVFVRIDTTSSALGRIASASGARYAGRGYELWSYGSEARLETPVGSHSECVGEAAGTTWDEARLLGFDFRAIGQEPGWLLEIDFDGMLHLATDYAQTHYYVATPASAPGDAADTAVLSARSDGVPIIITIASRPCEDVMSGEPFPRTVTVRVGEDELSGCGRYLGDPAE